jgi:hypothetical protein
MLANVLRQIRGIRAEPCEQRGSASPLPVSSDEVQVRNGSNPALVKKIAIGVLGLGNRYPLA